MKKNVILSALLGLAAGAAVTAAGAIAVARVSGEIKSEMGEQHFPSPNGDHAVTVSCGASKTAKGLTYLRVLASSEACEDTCALSLLTRRMPEELDVQWIDNEHFRLLVGPGARKQCCEITFEEDRISAIYSLAKQ
ncbi:MAG: hypothetical protein IIX80_00240 [Clostridia bacterium]|jgi:hypothetical protein|nr:hypothetical protein [Clostridia bacterium]